MKEKTISTVECVHIYNGKDMTSQSNNELLESQTKFDL